MSHSRRSPCRRILFILNRKSGRGAQVQLLEFKKYLEDHAVQIFYFSEFPRLKGIPALLGTVNRVKPDVVVTIGLGRSLFLGRLAALLFGVRIIYSTLETFENLHTRGERYFDSLNRLLNLYLRQPSYKRTVRFLPVCAKLGDRISKEAGTYPIRPLANAIDCNTLHRAIQPSDAARSIAQNTAAYPRLIQVGALDDIKNPLFSLRCLQRLRTAHPNVRLLFVGSGDREPAARTFCDSHAISDNVIFCGQLSHTDCLYLISQADILLLPSKTEACPLVLLECQGMAKPAVCFNVGGVSEIIEDGVTGYVVTPGDFSVFSSCVERLLANTGLARSMGDRARIRVNELFSLSRRRDIFINMIESDMEQLS